jgi:hypothetical protein
MKTKKITRILPVIAMTAGMIYFSSCKKEDTVNPSVAGSVQDRSSSSLVFSPSSRMYGHSYAEWSAGWWKWSMEFPITGHPFIDDPSFNISAGQSGQVWYLAAPFGTVVRTCNVPYDKALFVGLLNAEASDLEGLGTTYADQLANAKFNADHIINLTCMIDGTPVNDISSFRVASPQVSFNAPSPWIFGTTGGAGTSVGDGYYVMIKPLAVGSHIVHYTGSFHFTLANDGFDFDADIDMTYNLNVQ